MSLQNNCRSLQILVFLGLIASLVGGYAIAAPDVKKNLPCAINCDSKKTDELLNNDKPIAALIDLKKLDKKGISLVVEKSKYRLTVYYQNYGQKNHQKKPIKAYAIALGSNPKDDKLRQGDKRTPEGKFRVKQLYPHSEWSKFIWLDYPTADSWRKYAQAKARGEVSDQDSIGGEIGIHGVEKGQDWLIDRRINWTLGCISLKNKDVDEIYTLLQKGTAIEILH